MPTPARAPASAARDRTAPCACGGGCPRCAAGGGGAEALRIAPRRGGPEREARRAADEVMSPSFRRTARLSPVDPGTQPTGPGPAARPAADALSDAGRPLSTDDRAVFEPRFGRSFADVRIHTGARAAAAARALGTRAFTVGADIVLGLRSGAPGTAARSRLVAHELAHVVQQGAAQSRARAPPEAASVLQREDHAPEGEETSDLESLFGSDRDTVRDLMQSRQAGPACNWKVMMHDLSASVRQMIEPRFLGVRLPWGNPGLRVRSAKAESGFILTHRHGGSCNFGIDVRGGNVSAGFGSLKLDALRNVDWSVSMGPLGIGLNWSLFDPLASGVTWKVGYEHKGAAVSLGPDWTVQPFFEAAVEGDLSTYGRFALTAAYVVVGAALAAAAAAAIAAEAGLALAGAAAAALLALSTPGEGGSSGGGGA